MDKNIGAGVSRRKFLRVALVITPAFAITACGSEPTTAPATAVQAQPTASASSTVSAITTTATAQATPASTTATAVATATQAATAVATTAPATTVPPVTTAAPATAAVSTAAPAQAPVLSATPACSDSDHPTLAQTEGPYFKTSSPLRTSLIEPGLTGTKLMLTGYVLGTDCKPVKGALVDFWQADGNGQYDNQGFKMRGHQFTDETGRYSLETVLPGLYPGRTRHIHVKVQAPNKPVLTTQLYFPGEARNQSDSIFNKELVIEIKDATAIKQGAFNFALKLA